MRIICWFSCGAASAVATKLALKKYPDAEIWLIEMLGEHEDNYRFRNEAESWFDRQINSARNENYTDHFSVFQKEKIFRLKKGFAPCTTRLKTMVRKRIDTCPETLNIFGYCADKREEERAHRFQRNNWDLKCWFPLIDEGITHQRAVGMIANVGIDVPEMYKLGFYNNNCIGCVKGGLGYWNKVRVHFPEVFEKFSKLERELGRTILTQKVGRGDNRKGVPLFLDELEPWRGCKKDLEITCDFLCGAASEEL